MCSGVRVNVHDRVAALETPGGSNIKAFLVMTMSSHISDNAGLSQPRLPPELCDKIIDEVAVDSLEVAFINPNASSLLSPLALTCRSWLTRVRYNRWAEVSNLQDWRGRLQSFVALIYWIPEIAPYVKVLQFDLQAMSFCPSEDEDDEDVPTAGRPLIVSRRSTQDRHAPVNLRALIRKDASSEDIIYGLFSKLVNLVYVDIDCSSFVLTPRLAQLFPKLQFLQLCLVEFRSWADLRKVLRELPRLRKIFFRRTIYGEPLKLPPTSSDIDNPAPHLDEIGVTSFPDLMSDFHRIFIASSARSPVIDLSVGNTTRWGEFRQMSMKRARFMLSKHLEYIYSDVEPEDDDDDLINRGAVYLDRLDPRIQFYEVELIPEWGRSTDMALSSMFSWLTQISTREVEILIIRLPNIRDMAVLQSGVWTDITELLCAAFSWVQSLIVRFHPPDPWKCVGMVWPQISTVASEIEEQLHVFAQNGKLQFQFADYIKGYPQDDYIKWALLQVSDDGEEKMNEDSGSPQSAAE
ncbi:hypothetical protein CERSUDRAFT_71629 [Gelatoporia subvermispora B]|uniref:Uncharacterized protein n=1 Tax=Ceriporiopsis subvermispora (strain B) TaxID=914234 RepID=M2QRQ2_CERS8|nr:hypothetical protein CERSUDRAFT_71629 [Gelatoporia subvermispora B]